MNRIIDILSIIIAIVIIVISIINILNNFIESIRDDEYYLKIDSSNKEYIETIISENYKLTGTLDKVAYKQGLGDWYLFLYYKDGTEDETLFGDSNSEVENLRAYIRENGYNEGERSWNKIKISFWTIIVVSICESIYLIVRMITKKKIKSKR